MAGDAGMGIGGEVTPKGDALSSIWHAGGIQSVETRNAPKYAPKCPQISMEPLGRART